MTMGHARLARGTLCLLIATGAVFPGVADAQGRSWTGNGFINLNGGGQSGDQRFSDALDGPLYDELAVYANDYVSSGGSLIDVTGGVRVWHGLAAAFGVTIVNGSSTVDIAGSVPHPLFFDSARATALQRADLTHRQVGFHFQVVYLIPLTDAIDVAVFAGPSVFRVEQDFVSDITLGPEIDPFDTVALAGAPTQAAQETGIGGNVGADVTYMFTDILGVGGFVRYTTGSVDFTTSDGVQRLDAGGTQAGIGVRARF